MPVHIDTSTRGPTYNALTPTVESDADFRTGTHRCDHNLELFSELELK